ncbi:MAG: hypothetical protein AAGB31_02585 [Bdellovibrio sp.]
MTHLDQLPHPESLPYPNRYTAAFFSSSEEAERSISDLEMQGYTDEDFNVFEGNSGIAAIDADGNHHNMLENYMRKFIRFSDSAEWKFLHEADIEIRNGHILLCVPTSTEEQKKSVVDIFHQNGAYDIRYFTPLYIEEVES